VSDVATASAAVGLAASRADVVATVGVHPHDASTYSDTLEAELLELMRSPHVVAVGEAGLDFHYEHSPRAAQEDAFRRQIHLARALGKPIVVHTREAPQETLAALREEGAFAVGGVIHCFSEDRAFAEQALDLGFSISFSGIVTFKNAVAIQDVARWMPLDQLLLETDSPYLAPVPLRGRRCEPAYLCHTARHVAALRGVPVQELGEASSANAVRRFGPRLKEALDTGRSGFHSPGPSPK
jgi:TatD DNase family protein